MTDRKGKKTGAPKPGPQTPRAQGQQASLGDVPHLPHASDLPGSSNAPNAPDPDAPDPSAPDLAKPAAPFGPPPAINLPSVTTATRNATAKITTPKINTGNVSHLPSADRREKLRILEAVLFAASEPLDETSLAKHLKAGDDTKALIEELQGFYASRGVNLVRVAARWAFRTADDLSYLLERHAKEERKLSRAAMETMAIIAYHQPVTRAEIEEIRGVATSGGTLDVLMETGWIRPRGRRRAPGRPITYGTTAQFLEHFGMDAIKDLPGLAELKGAGLLDSSLPPDFTVPEPTDVAALMPDEVPLDALEEAHQASLPLEDLADDEPLDDDAPPKV